MSCYVFGIGATVELVNRKRTLIQLEEDLHRAREMGAPDDATVVSTARGSTYVAEVIWVGKP